MTKIHDEGCYEHIEFYLDEQSGFSVFIIVNLASDCKYRVIIDPALAQLLQWEGFPGIWQHLG
jgi:hypothetical protein